MKINNHTLRDVAAILSTRWESIRWETYALPAGAYLHVFGPDDGTGCDFELWQSVDDWAYRLYDFNATTHSSVWVAGDGASADELVEAVSDRIDLAATETPTGYAAGV